MEPSTYLGKKGYTIYKECISVEEQQDVRKELTVKAYIPKSPTQPEAFPIYREAHNKFYMPRYYGNENFDNPDEVRSFIEKISKDEKTIALFTSKWMLKT